MLLLCFDIITDTRSPSPAAVDITRTNVTSSRTRFPGQTQETTCDEASPSPPPAAVKEIAQNTYRHKGVTWRGETDAEKRERTEKDAMTNEPGDIEEGELCGWFVNVLKFEILTSTVHRWDAS